MKRLGVICGIVIWGLILSSPVYCRPEPDKTWIDFHGEAGYRYLLKPPSRVEPGRTYPLLIVLHGMDGRAEEIMRLFEFDEEARGWYIAAPQARTIPRKEGDVVTWEPNRDTTGLMELIGHLKTSLPVDAGRIALAGYSAGAWMSMRLLDRAPMEFSRLALVAGGAPEKTAAPQGLNRLNVFLLAAETDGHFDKKQVKTLKKALTRAGARVQWKVVKGTDHSSICNHFNLVRDWMFHR